MPAHRRTVRLRTDRRPKFRTSVRTGTDDSGCHPEPGCNRRCLSTHTTKVIAMPPSIPHLDNNKLEQFFGRFVQDLGAVMHAATLLVGDRLGLYQAMADSQWSLQWTWLNGQKRTNGTWPNGWQLRPQPDTPNMTPTPSDSGSPRSRLSP